MSLTKQETTTLQALALEHAESRRPVKPLIVMAACNAKSDAAREQVLVTLASLKRQSLVTQHDDAWAPTTEGHAAARQLTSGTVLCRPKPGTIPEKPPVRPPSRDTLRPRQLTAPKPVTRPETAPVTSPAFDDPDAPVADHQDEDTPAMTETRAPYEAQGRKDDGEKLRMDLLFTDMPRALAEVVDVLTQGARKYAPGNWQHVDDAERRYLAASLRHELALARGERSDAETQCHHLAHSICCDLFRLELVLRGGEQ